jgi:hypothetical protein
VQIRVQSRRKQWLLLVGLCQLAVLLACASPAFAGREHIFSKAFGELCTVEPTECTGKALKEPDGVAVNEATGDVFVVDKGANRLVRFNAAGVFQSEVTGPSASGTGTLSEGSTTIESALATTGGFSVGEEVSAPGLPAGTVITALLGAGSLEVSNPVEAGKSAVGAELKAQQRFESPETIALDNSCALRKLTDDELTQEACESEDPSSEDVYVVDAGNRVVDKFSSAGEFIGQITQAPIGLEKSPLEGVSVDRGGTLWIYRQEKNAVVDRFSNALVNQYSSPQIPLEPKKNGSPTFAEAGFAIDRQGDFYGRVGNNAPDPHPKIDKFSSSGTLVFEELGKADASAVSVDQSIGGSAFIDNVSSVAAFSPEGVLVERLGEEGGVKHLSQGAGIGVDAGAGSLYVADAAAGTVVVFGPAPASTPRVEGESFSAVTSISARLEAQINPRSEEAPGEGQTTFRFDYGACPSVDPASCKGAPYGHSTPPGGLPPDFNTHPVSAAVTGLSPHTTYHFRVLASNKHGEAVPGEEQTFTTEAGGGEGVLPDNRGWEMVSPPEKHGALIEPIPEIGVVQAAADGSAITYLAQSPTEPEPTGYANLVQVLSTRNTASWSSRDIAIPHASAAGFPVGFGPEYRFFDRDLQTSAVQPFGEFMAFSEEASESTSYLREVGPSCGSHCFHPLVTSKAGFADVPEGTHFGQDELCVPKVSGVPVNTYCGPAFVGATVDLHHVVLESNVPLVKGAVGRQLYDWNEGHLSQVSVLPDGENAPDGAGLGRELGNAAQGAISSDGTRIVWEIGPPQPPSLYLRDMTADEGKGETVQLDAAEPSCESCVSGGGLFQFANSEGTRVYFTDQHKLTEHSGAEHEKADLYECQIVATLGSLGCDLTDLTPSRGGESAAVPGAVLGASEDGSYVYFVAKGVLSEAANSRGLSADAGQPNLYLRHDGATSFIATLTGGNGTFKTGDESDWTPDLGQQPTRVSPDGQWLELMSEAPITGYDNRDRESGRPVAEVYLYHAATNRLTCASCEPSGERPRGVEEEKLETRSSGVAGGTHLWPEHSLVGANVEGWMVIQKTAARYQPRYLNDEGRLFFNSGDALVPQDSNGTEDVYEYEPPGVGDCGEASVTFSARSGGCVSLVSSGSSPQESAFLDASESGDDVFFLTAARLSRIDTDNSFDVYDAHRCTSALPCIAFPEVQSSPCENEASCKPAPTPQPSIFAAPASATFSGPGNLTPGPSNSAKPKTAAQLRAERLRRALRACRARRNKRRRVACERQAHRSYAPLKAKRKRSKSHRKATK